MGLVDALSRGMQFGRRTTPNARDDGQGFRGILRAVQSGHSEHVTEETALNFSAVYAAVRILSQALKVLPVSVYRELPNGGKALDAAHPAHRLLHRRPAPGERPDRFRQYLEMCRQLWGNGYAEIAFDKRGQPESMWPIHPSRVEVCRDNNGPLYYHVHNNDGTVVPLPAQRVLHVMNVSLDGDAGVSPVHFARVSIGLGIAAERHGQQFYGNNAQPGVILTHQGNVGDELENNIRRSWTEAWGGGGNRFGAAVFGDDMKITQLGMPHADAQFLETRVFQVEEIARWFGLPPHKLAELSRATFSNIEEQSLGYVGDAILPSVVEWEEECNLKLFREDETDRFTKFKLNALLRANAESRASYYKTMVEAGIYNRNEVRSLEDMNPMGSDGDKYTVQLNMTTLDKVGQDEPEPEPAPLPELPDPEPDPEPEPDDKDDEAERKGEMKAAALAMVDETLHRLRRKEIKTVRSAAKRMLGRGDVDKFRSWVPDWYERYAQEMSETLDKPMRLALMFTGADSGGAEAAILAEVKGRVSASRGQLLGLLKDSVGNEAAAINARLDEWETENE